MKVPLVSCGVLVMNADSQLLMGHATGAAHWDIPKGVAEPGEQALEAAVRELEEESGLIIAPERLHPVGRLAYRPGKELQLFAVLADGLDPGACTCRSCFTDRRGRSRPELDRFAWVPFDEVQRRAAASMAAVLTRRLSLPAILDGLRKSPAPSG